MSLFFVTPRDKLGKWNDLPYNPLEDQRITNKYAGLHKNWAEKGQSQRRLILWSARSCGWKLSHQPHQQCAQPRVPCQEHAVYLWHEQWARVKPGSKCSGSQTLGLTLRAMNLQFSTLPLAVPCSWDAYVLDMELQGPQLYFIQGSAFMPSFPWPPSPKCTPFTCMLNFYSMFNLVPGVIKMFSCLPPWNIGSTRQKYHFVHWCIPHA